MLQTVRKSLVSVLRSYESPPKDIPPLGAQHVEGATLLPDRIALLDRLPKQGCVMECGVDEGHFSAQILERCNPKRLTLVDPWSSKRFGNNKFVAVQQRFEPQINNDSITLLRKNSLEALGEAEDDSLDWIYIDSDHSYRTTKAELLLSQMKVKHGGLICGHDYTVGSWENFFRYGVIEAVNEFCVTHNWRFAYLTHEPRRHLTFCLTKI